MIQLVGQERTVTSCPFSLCCIPPLYHYKVSSTAGYFCLFTTSELCYCFFFFLFLLPKALMLLLVVVWGSMSRSLLNSLQTNDQQTQYSFGILNSTRPSCWEISRKKSCLGEKTNGKLKSQDGSLIQFADRLCSIYSAFSFWTVQLTWKERREFS